VWRMSDKRKYMCFSLYAKRRTLKRLNARDSIKKFCKGIRCWRSDNRCLEKKTCKNWKVECRSFNTRWTFKNITMFKSDYKKTSKALFIWIFSTTGERQANIWPDMQENAIYFCQNMKYNNFSYNIVCIIRVFCNPNGCRPHSTWIIGTRL